MCVCVCVFVWAFLPLCQLSPTVFYLPVLFCSRWLYTRSRNQVSFSRFFTLYFVLGFLSLLRNRPRMWVVWDRIGLLLVVQV